MNLYNSSDLGDFVLEEFYIEGFCPAMSKRGILTQRDYVRGIMFLFV